MSKRFEGRAAVVTGGVSGIGAGIAARLAAEGAALSLWDMDEAGLARSGAGAHRDAGRHRPRRRSSRCRCDRRRTWVKSTYWSPPPASPVRTADLGVSGRGLGQSDRCQSEGRLLLQPTPSCRSCAHNSYGRIVNIASIAGKDGNPNASAYSASKAGVIGLTKSLGKELADTDIRVNCVTPAAVRRRMFDQMTQQQIDWMLSKIPIGRFGEIDEVASLVLWLASEECSVLHRRRVRHLRRTGDLLNGACDSWTYR